jgi:ATP-binding protein involved in chromosome partitioning
MCRGGTRAQDIALIDARRGATMFRKVAVPALGIVENMSFYVCPGCGQEAHIFGHGGAARTGQELGMELLGQARMIHMYLANACLHPICG